MTRTLAACLIALALVACTRPGEERALAEDDVGHAAIDGLAIDADDGLVVIRGLAPGTIALWASAPIVDLTLTAPAAGDWQLTIENVLPDAIVTSATLAIGAEAPRVRPTVMTVIVTVPAGTHRLHLGPADESPGRFRFASMGDLQTGLPTVDDLFRAIGETGARFVTCTGDLTDRGLIEEYDLLARQLETLPVPFYTTLGNHELWEDPVRFRERYGRSSFQFRFRGVAFTFADSGDAGLDPIVEQEVDGWLLAARDRVQVFLTHFPPIDPVGVRYGSFRSRLDGHRLIGKLATAGVDLALYGHIHSFLTFEHAGIPAFVSGGGGAMPERWDGIGRHFLVVDIDPDDGHATVGVHRID